MAVDEPLIQAAVDRADRRWPHRHGAEAGPICTAWSTARKIVAG